VSILKSQPMKRPATNAINVIHTVGRLSLDTGGPARSVPALCDEIARCHPDWRVEIVSGSNEGFGAINLPSRASVSEVDGSFLDRKFELCIAEKVGGESSALLHDHGQWLPINRASAAVARNLGIPRIVSPRGMLSPWARNHRWWKKRIAWQWFAKRDLAEAVVLHATSKLEATELRALGARQPIAVVPNGVDDSFDGTSDREKSGRPYVLFLSRIHIKKGVRELLEAWERLGNRDWGLVIAGPDEQRILSPLQLPANVCYIGAVEGEEKLRLLKHASLFVLPSYSENFGIVVAEALMAGVPVITTHGTPWDSLVREQCGWWIPMDVDRLCETLRSAFLIPEHELRMMGMRGRSFARREFSWPSIAAAMSSVYQWVLTGGSRPSCVHVAT
jgi:glycosyltransferase involved in cell wall biosynthesis